MAYKTKEIECPGCHGVYFKTTRKFSPKKQAVGKMMRLKEEFENMGWPKIHQEAVGGNIICPFCEESMLTGDNRLITL